MPVADRTRVEPGSNGATGAASGLHGLVHLDLLGRNRARAERLLAELPFPAQIIEGQSVIGGGSTPDQSLPTFLLAIPQPEMERRLRLGEPPIIARVEKGQLLIDLRTVFPHEEQTLLSALLI